MHGPFGGGERDLACVRLMTTNTQRVSHRPDCLSLSHPAVDDRLRAPMPRSDRAYARLEGYEMRPRRMATATASERRCTPSDA